MDEIVNSGGYDTVLYAIATYVRDNVSDNIMRIVMHEDHVFECIYIEFILTALKYEDDVLDIVVRACTEIASGSVRAPSTHPVVSPGLLSYYVTVHDDISWKVVSALTKVSNLIR